MGSRGSDCAVEKHDKHCLNRSPRSAAAETGPVDTYSLIQCVKWHCALFLLSPYPWSHHEKNVRQIPNSKFQWRYINRSGQWSSELLRSSVQGKSEKLFEVRGIPGISSLKGGFILAHGFRGLDSTDSGPVLRQNILVVVYVAEAPYLTPRGQEVERGRDLGQV
jgi:hypothetical protein